MHLSANCQIIIQIKDAEQEDAELACQQSPQVAADPVHRDEQEHASDADEQADGIDDKGERRLPDPVDDADECIVRIEERAYPGEGDDEASGCRALEQEGADPASGQEEEGAAAASKQHTAGDDFFDNGGHLPLVIERLYLRHGREEHG